MMIATVFHVEGDNKYIVKDFYMLNRVGVRLYYSSKCVFTVYHNSESFFVVEVKSKHLDHYSGNIKSWCFVSFMSHFPEGDGVLREHCRLCVTNIDFLRKIIMEKAHGSRYSIVLTISCPYKKIYVSFIDEHF